MSVFVPGTGGDLKSTTLPGALLEVAQRAQLAEQALTPAKNNISLSMNAEGTLCTLTASIPVATTISTTSGDLKVSAVDYIV